ncbi:MAG: VanW family protein [Clostridia bacterium]|nr:VanW family protein [Clostridia bacterium]
MQFGILASVLAAGALFFGTVEKGVVIDGIDVGGMTYRQAMQALDRTPTLTIETPSGNLEFSQREIYERSNVYDLLGAKRGTYESERIYGLKGETDVFERICMDYHERAVDASVSFDGSFSYHAGNDGRAVDPEKLKEDVFRSLNETHETVRLSFKEEKRKVTEAELRTNTAKLSAFFTTFDAENRGRSKNIALAASKINGTVLYPHETFSFNRTVGARTEANGFQKAAVIMNGVYTEGVGGGVCQVSTTLYNAALLAGLTVTESRAHSLSVGYVAPSFDAMVSSSSDLKFVNPHDTPVYLSCRVNNGKLTATVYGKSDGRVYECSSTVLSTILPPEEEIVYGEREEVVRRAKSGLISEGYLNVYEGGKLVERRRIRKDKYQAVRGIIRKVQKID